MFKGVALEGVHYYVNDMLLNKKIIKSFFHLLHYIIV
jgi:hypothetical protein